MQHLFFAFTNPVDGVEPVFNDWYNTHHVPEVLRYGRGFTGCRRFRLEREAGETGLPAWTYLAMYQLESDDLASLATKPWTVQAPPLTSFRGLLKDDHVAWVYTPRGPRIARSAWLPDTPEHVASHIMLEWAHEPQAFDAQNLQQVVEQSDGCRAAQILDLADAQRSNQQGSPWQSLVVYELNSAEVEIPGARRAAAWTYTAIADFVSRDQVMASV